MVYKSNLLLLFNGSTNRWKNEHMAKKPLIFFGCLISHSDNLNVSWIMPLFLSEDTIVKSVQTLTRPTGYFSSKSKRDFGTKRAPHLTDNTWNVQEESPAAGSLSLQVGIRELWLWVKQQKHNLVSLSTVVWNLSVRRCYVQQITSRACQHINSVH